MAKKVVDEFPDLSGATILQGPDDPSDPGGGIDPNIWSNTPGTAPPGGPILPPPPLPPDGGVVGGSEVGPEITPGTGEIVPGAVTPGPVEPPIPAAIPGPVPADDGTVTTGDPAPAPAPVPALAAPPTFGTATGLPTFGVGRGLQRSFRSPQFTSNRLVGGDTRFDSGIPVAPAALPSGLDNATGMGSGQTDEELLKQSILRGRRGR